jgi:cytochrome c-type biogenesis protein
MQNLIASFTNAVESAAPIAVPLALLWGVLSVLLSPCHLASVPLVVGYISRQGNTGSARAFSISILFSLGILITIILVGIATAAAGRILGDIGRFGYYLAAVMMLYFGLNLLEVVPSPWKGTRGPAPNKTGLTGAFLLGLAFGIALGPCTFAFMAPILGVTLSTGSEHLIFSILLIVAFAIGHCGVIIAAGTFSTAIQRYLKWNEKSGIVPILRKICGILVILGGLYLLYRYT